MKSAIILALTSSSLAMPFGNVIDAVFGTASEARHHSHSGHLPSNRPIGTGSGNGFPFPTGTGLPFPTGTGLPFSFPVPTATGPAAFALGTGRPSGRPGHHGHHSHSHEHKSKTLAIDYELAPTAAPLAKIGKVEKRQDTPESASLPNFSFLNPSDGVSAAPTATGEPESPFPTASGESPFPFPTGTGSPELPFPTGGFPAPTGGFPAPTGGFPGGFPGTGIPSLPTTLETLTRGPQPTGTPASPSSSSDEQSGDEEAQGWLEWLEGVFGGESKTSN